MFKSNFSEGYKIDADHLAEVDTAKTIKFEDHIKLLKSKSEEEYKANEALFDDEFRFLDKSTPNDRVAFSSLPGSGELTLRNLIEKVTGISTGSSISLNTSTILQCRGQKGEAITDDRVWIVKTHHPAKNAQSLTFEAKKMICLVRNPLHVIENFANQTNTMSYDSKAEFQYSTEFADWWDWWITEQCANQKKYFATLQEQTAKANILFVRYEDLEEAPKRELTKVM
jgi:hypothetical protein